ncbi:MAG: DUF1329 domain-containing protein [Deltaproteobacteria bacterium]|nr:DUF1329 domain-containing protein [Deltaproteobacteria bacterium]
MITLSIASSRRATRALAAVAVRVARRAGGKGATEVAQSGASAAASCAARGLDTPQSRTVATRRTLRAARGAAKAALGALLLAAPTMAEVKPGDVVNAANLEAAREWLTPGLEWCVRRGMTLRVAAPRPIEAPAPYREATERFAPQVRLGSDRLTLQNYVAGLPFPVIDPADPQAAVKVMWNSEYKWLATDDLDARDFDADAGAIGRDGAGMRVERHFVLGYLRRLFFTGRLFVDPKPVWPNPDGIRYRESLHPVVEPADLRGVGMTSVRYVAPTRPDESWLYLPNLRRVRRLSSAQRSDPLFNQDIDADSYFGYSGQVGWMDWKFLGERTVLAPMHGEHLPVQWGAGSADFAFDDVWEPRQVYVVEGTSKLPQYAYAKRVLYVDKDTWVVPLSDLYARDGQLWKVWLNLFSFRREPFAGAKTSVYPSDMGFSPAVVMVDIAADHATRVALPSRTSGSEGWFFNMGDRLGLSEDWFKIAHLIQTAP